MKNSISIISLILLLFFLGCRKEITSIEKSANKEISVITIPSSKGEIVKHAFYTLSYIEANEQAEWVYYKLTSDMILGNQERTEDFRIDSTITTGSADLSDYVGSGYDRGHLCPAADMAISFNAMSESFYLSNISPQNESFNRGIWKTLESTVRNIAKNEKEIYVVTGPVFKNNKGVIGTNNVTVPGYFYKIVYAPSKEKMIGFVLPNETGTKEIRDYVVTIDSVEKLTSIDMFPQLTTDMQTKLEGKIDINNWNLTPLEDPTPTPDPTPNPTGCPTTANCGCSGKTKSVCPTDPCCQWIAGTGCKCK